MRYILCEVGSAQFDVLESTVKVFGYKLVGVEALPDHFRIFQKPVACHEGIQLIMTGGLAEHLDVPVAEEPEKLEVRGRVELGSSTVR